MSNHYCQQTENHTCISLAISRSSRLRFLRMSLRKLSLCFNSCESRRCWQTRFSRSSDVSCLRCRFRSMRSWRSTESNRLFITCMHAAILSTHATNHSQKLHTPMNSDHNNQIQSPIHTNTHIYLTAICQEHFESQFFAPILKIYEWLAGSRSTTETSVANMQLWWHYQITVSQ